MAKEYISGDLTVVWNPEKCIHAAECVKGLPQVFRPNQKPWIKLDTATSQQLCNTIDKCPSGALTYKMKEKMNNEKNTTATKVNVSKGGPLLVHGNIEVKHANGTVEQKSKITAFCRCGASGNHPYCDGSHSKCGFEG